MSKTKDFFNNIIGSLGSILPSLLFFTVAGLWGRENEKTGYFGAALIFGLLGGMPMFFYKFDEKAQADKLKKFREEKERREIEELNKLAQETEVK